MLRNKNLEVAKQRLKKLLDTNSFELMDDLNPTINLLGKGLINGKRVYCCAGISVPQKVNMLQSFKNKIAWMEKILEDPAPVIWLHDFPQNPNKGKTPIPPNSDELLASNNSSVGRVFCLQARINQKVIQISALFSDAGAAQTFPVRIADFVLLKKGTHMWVGRPDAVKLMLGSEPNQDELGSAEMHCKQSGVGDVLFEKDEEAITWIRNCISSIPIIKGDETISYSSEPPLLSAIDIKNIIPEDLNKPFNIRPIIDFLVDGNSWLGYQELLSPEVITGIAKLDGFPVGIIANNSIKQGGIIYPGTCRKMVRFIKLCEKYKIPLVFLADNPGLMVGVRSEQEGMIYEASELLVTLATITIPRACIVIRKAYTVGLYSMAGPGFDPTLFSSLPNGSISVFGPKALERFSKDQDIPPLLKEAIDSMYHHATHPEDYEQKGLLHSIIKLENLTDVLQSFAKNSFNKN